MPSSGGQTCALRSEEHTSELQSHDNLVCRLLVEKKSAVRAQPLYHRGRSGQRLVRHTTPDPPNRETVIDTHAQPVRVCFFLMKGHPRTSSLFPCSALLP